MFRDRYNLMLDAASSSDDVGIAGYSWTVQKESAIVDSSTSASWTFHAESDGTFVVTLTVTDTYGHTSKATESFAIGPPFGYHNGAPTAIIASSTDGWNVTLDATGSFDPDGDPLSFTWRLDSRELHGPVVRHHLAEDGQYQVSLVARDPYGLDSRKDGIVQFTLDRSIAVVVATPIYVNTTTDFHLAQFRAPLDGNFTWRIPELNVTRSGPTLTMAFAAPGNYTLQVKGPGQQLLATREIQVKEKLETVSVAPSPQAAAPFPGEPRAASAGVLLVLAGLLVALLRQRR